MESKKYSMDLAGRELTLEFGKYCEQAAAENRFFPSPQR